MGVRGDLVILLISLIIFQLTTTLPRVAGTNDLDTNGPLADEQITEDAMYAMMDNIMVDLTTSYNEIKTDDFWHPHDFATGNDNREVINVVGISEEHVQGKFVQWKNMQFGLKQYLVGLQQSSLHIYDSSLKEIVVKEMPDKTLERMEVLTRWNTETLTPFMVILVATESPSPNLFAFTLVQEEKEEQQALKEIGSLPLASPVKSLMALEVERSEKIMVVPRDAKQPISVYNMHITPEEVQLWFFQRISEPNFKAAVVHQPDTQNGLLLISSGKRDQLNVYKFDEPSGQFVVSQMLPLEHNCQKMISFSMMYQHYVSCLPEENQQTSRQAHFISYNFNTNEYEEKPFKHVEASDLFPVSVGESRENLILLTLSSSEDKASAVKTLIYDGNSEFKLSGTPCQLASCVDLQSLSNAETFEYEQSATAIALPTKPAEDHASVLIFVTEVTARSSPVLQQSMLLFSQFKDLSKGMARWRDVVSVADSTLQRSLNVNGDNEISGNWTVKRMTAEEVEVKEGRKGRTSDNVFNRLKFGTVEWTEEDFISANEQLTSQITQMQDNLDFVGSRLNDALLRSSDEVQVIKSETIMSGLMTAAQGMQVSSINMRSMMGGVQPQHYFNSLASSKSEPLEIGGGLTFTPMLTSSHVETPKLSSHHSSILVEQMALLSEHNVFECPSTFEKISTGRDLQVDKVNGLQFADAVLFANEVSNFHFVDGLVAYANAMNFAEPTPFDNVLLSSTFQTITAPLAFQSLEMQAPFLAVKNLNDKPFTQFVDQVITTNFRGKITGTKTLSQKMELDKLFIQNSWNKLEFPGAFFQVTQPTIETMKISGDKTFSHVVADTVTVSQAVNGINTDELVSLSGSDLLSHSTWKLNGRSQIAKNINVEQTVDGIKMESLHHTGFLVSSSHFSGAPNAEIVFKQPIHVQDLSVKSLINGRTFQELFANLILFHNEKVCSIPGHTVINGDVSFLDVHLNDNQINGFSVENFLTRDTVQSVSKPVKILESVFFEQLNAHQLFDNVKLNEILESALRVSRTMESVEGIPWDIHFERMECQNKLTVEHSVNGLFNYGRNAARTKDTAPQIINGPVETSKPVLFKSLTVSDLRLDPGRTLQNLEITEWSASRAQLSEPASFPQPVSVSRLVVQDNLDSLQINGISVDTISNGVLRTTMDKSQVEFTGPIHFSKGLSVHKGDIRFHENVDGFNLDEFVAHGFPLKANSHSQPTLVSNEMNFQSLKLNQDVQLSSSPLVCGVNLENLQSDSVKKSDLSVDVFGEKRFSSPLAITQRLSSPHLNGKSFSKAFLLNGDQQVDRHATFTSHVTKNKLSTSSINQIDLSTLSNKFSSDGKVFKVDHDVFMKGHPLKTDNLRVTGTTNRQNLDEFFNDAIQLASPQITFPNPVTMQNPISVDKQITTQTYNGIQMDKLLEQVVLLREDVILTQPTTFKDHLTAPEVRVQGDLSANQLTNNIDWADLTENGVKINEPINLANMQFEQLSVFAPITTLTLNEKPFEEYITLNTEQNLGRLQISSLSLESSTVHIGGLLGSHNLSSEFHDTLMENEENAQRLFGKVTFSQPVHIKKSIQCFGSSFTANVVTTSEPLDLEGPLEFSSPIVVEGETELDGSLGGLAKVENLFDNSFNPNRVSGLPSEIGKNWVFTGPVTFLDNVSGPGVTDEVNIQSLMDKTHEQMARAQSEVDDERKEFSRKCNSLRKIRNEIAQNPVKLDGFEEHQTIKLENPVVNMLTLASGTQSPILLMQTANCKVVQYQWESESESFHKVIQQDEQDNVTPSLSTTIGMVHSWQAASQNEDDGGGTIIAFSRSSESPCSTAADDQAVNGLFFVTLSRTGQLTSAPTPIQMGQPVSSFQLLSHPNTGEIKLFNLDSSGVQIFSWERGQLRFSNNPQLVSMSSPMNSLRVTTTSRGFGIICHNENSMLMYELDSLSDPTNLATVSQARMMTRSITSGALGAFQRLDGVHALIAESDRESLVKPSCNLQVLRLSDHSTGSVVQSVQKFAVPQMISSTMWSFSGKQFAAFLSKSNGLFVYKFKGLNGFEQLGGSRPYKVFDGLALESFSVKMGERSVPQPILLVLSQNKVELLKGTVLGDTLNFDFEPLCNS